MITEKQIQKEIENISTNLIINSNNNEWKIKFFNGHYEYPRTILLIKNNIKIETIIQDNPKYFNVKIFTDNTFSILDTEIELRFNWCLNKIKRNERKLLKEKFKELKSYQASKIYNLLPIKELRKMKLEKIQDEIK